MPQNQLSIEDAIAAIREWEIYRDNWLASLAQAKQPKPTSEQLSALRETWGEGFLIGRLSK